MTDGREEAAVKCEHAICDCVITEAMDYCSVHCLEATEHVTEATTRTLCECGHAECRGTVELEPVLDEPDHPLEPDHA